MSYGLKIITLVTLLSIARTGFSQDPEFSQFYANPLYLNPALAGATSGPRAVAGYRNQWPGMGNAFITYHASYDMYISQLHGGAGLDITYDQAGSGNLNTLIISAMYAYKFNITDRLQASGAIKGGYYQWNLATTKLTFGNPGNWDPILSDYDYYNMVGVPDFGTGIFLSYDNLVYGGIAVDHLAEPNISFSSINSIPLYRKFTAHAGSVINLRSGGSDEDREFSISPNVLYQQQFKFHQLNLGFYLTIDPVILGAWYRYNFENSDAVIPMIGFHWKNLHVGYSYDYSLSKLKDASGGAHEISASWQFAAIEKRRVIRAIKCPRF